MEFISKVGIELEGGWSELFPEEDPTEIYADHSVRVGGFKHTGEVASPPLELEEALKWADVHYPSGSDASCGMHIHISTKRDEDYAKLCQTPHFFMKFLRWGDEFIKALPKENKVETRLFYSRLSGENRFCALKFIPSQQLPLRVKGGGNNVETNPRYAMLNFCKNIHNTMENRAFPIFPNKEVGLSAIKGYVEMVEGFLMEKKEMKDNVFKVVL